MRLLAITDIHGRRNYDSKINSILSRADLVVIAGDITNFGGKNDALAVLDTLKSLNQNLLAVPGNCDQSEVTEVLKHEGINLHGEVKTFNNLCFFGIGGSGFTPFNTPQEYSDEEIELLLGNFREAGRIQIFVSHAPPFDTKVDRTVMGIHVGGKHIRSFIEKHQPVLCICGHIHEARGIDRIGNTLIVNPGPFPKHYALIDISEKVEVQLSD